MIFTKIMITNFSEKNTMNNIGKMKTKWEGRFFSKKIYEYSSIEFSILSRIIELWRFENLKFSLKVKRLILKFFQKNHSRALY